MFEDSEVVRRAESRLSSLAADPASRRVRADPRVEEHTSAGEMPSSRFALDDDIDDLLKELDMAGVGGGGSARTSTTAPEPTPAPCARVEATLASREPAPPAPPAQESKVPDAGNDLDDLLADLEDAMGGGGAAAAPAIIPPSFARVSDVTRTPKTTGGGGGAVKCSPAPMIASMATPPGGPASAFSEAVACDALRCVSCDFDVVSFDDAAWIDKVESAPEGRAKVTGSSPGAGVDYMFFRNRYPDDRKLREGMVRQVGARAYCCQCTWRWLDKGEREKVAAVGGKMRWVCGGH